MSLALTDGGCLFVCWCLFVRLLVFVSLAHLKIWRLFKCVTHRCDLFSPWHWQCHVTVTRENTLTVSPKKYLILLLPPLFFSCRLSIINGYLKKDISFKIAMYHSLKNNSYIFFFSSSLKMFFKFISLIFQTVKLGSPIRGGIFCRY